MRFSILYDPTQDLKAAIKGFLFRGVPTLVSTSPRPPVVWYRPEQEGLAVYSLGTRSEKLLPLACTAVFSTNASHTMLHLCDIVAYAPNAFPCKACIIKDSSAAKCFPSNAVTLRSKSVASVLVCSALSPRGHSPKKQEILPSPITKSPLHSLEGVAVIQPPAAFKEDVSSGDEDEDSGQLTVSL
eukprot:Em0002g192a